MVEVDLRDGCSMAFGTLFRDLRDSVLPDKRVIPDEFDTDEDDLDEVDLSLGLIRDIPDVTPDIHVKILAFVFVLLFD